MAVIYLFNAQKQPKQNGIINEVLEVIHSEGEYQASAQVRIANKPQNGEYFGFHCVDGRFRMFLATKAESKDQNGTCTVTGVDAALAELDNRIARSVTLKNVTLGAAVAEAISGTAWQLGSVTADMDVEIYADDIKYETRWHALKKAAEAANVRVLPHYVFEDGEIKSRLIDIEPRVREFSGLIITKKRGASNIIITQDGAPKGRAFGVGKAVADGNPPTPLTFADVEWSKANGDPVDKPLGQDWVTIEGSENAEEYVYESRYETDPAKLLKKTYEDLVKQQQPKASGRANLADFEYLPGYEHRAVHVFDRVAVRTVSGLTVESTVTNIDRYYVHRELTKLTIGDEKSTNTLEAQMAKLNAETKSAGRGAGGASAGAQEVRVITLQALDRIELLSKEINLRAYNAEVLRIEEETLVRHNLVMADLDAVNARLDLTVSQTDVDNLNNIVNEVQSQLTIQAGQISSRVSKNGVISAINQTAENITINANRINLEGYVTANELQAQIARIDKFFSGTSTVSRLDANSLTCQTAQITNLSLINADVEWKDGDYVTDVTFPSYYETTIYFVDWDGEKVYQRVLLPTKRSAGNVSKDTNHKYLGRKQDN